MRIKHEIFAALNERLGLGMFKRGLDNERYKYAKVGKRVHVKGKKTFQRLQLR
jgi:hypothetical protein